MRPDTAAPVRRPPGARAGARPGRHLLLGILFAGGPAGQALASSGLDAETAERLMATEFLPRCGPG
jgi:hypothetical protein